MVVVDGLLAALRGAARAALSTHSSSPADVADDAVADGSSRDRAAAAGIEQQPQAARSSSRARSCYSSSTSLSRRTAPRQLFGRAMFLASTASSYQASAISHQPTIIQEAGRGGNSTKPTRRGGRAVQAEEGRAHHDTDVEALEPSDGGGGVIVLSSYQHLLTIKHQPDVADDTVADGSGKQAARMTEPRMIERSSSGKQAARRSKQAAASRRQGEASRQRQAGGKAIPHRSRS
jgi:hypothetical protein